MSEREQPGTSEGSQRASVLVRRAYLVGVPSAPPAAAAPRRTDIEQAALKAAHGGSAASAVAVAAKEVETPPPSVKATPKPVQQTSGNAQLFRHEALRAYQRGEALSAPLAIQPLPTRVLFWTCLLMVSSALLVAVLGEVELTSKGRGVIRAPSGVQPVAAPVTGLIREISVEAGALVSEGQRLVQIDSPDVKSALLEAERHLEATRTRLDAEARHAQRMYTDAVRRLQHREHLMRRRSRSQQRSAARLVQSAQRVEMLDEEGLIDRGSLESAQHEVDGAERAFLALEDQLAQTEIELGRLLRERDSDAARRAQELADAEAKVDAARIWVGETFVTAPRAGQVEGLSVHTGQLVQTGTLLARIVPSGTPSSLVAFLPERDRAFLREGAKVKLDVDRLPVGEFGSLAARVTRISQDIAHPEELATALGAAAPEGVWFRVALELTEDERMTRLAPYLRSGTLVTVRAPLRTRRIIALVFDPIRRWLE